MHDAILVLNIFRVQLLKTKDIVLYNYDITKKIRKLAMTQLYYLTYRSNPIFFFSGCSNSLCTGVGEIFL